MAMINHLSQQILFTIYFFTFATTKDHYTTLMLRKTRIILASIFYVCILAIFLDFTGSVHNYIGWIAKMQFIPAIFSVNIIVITFLILLTIIGGRIYCSVICPLGITQDIISWIANKRHKNRFTHSTAKNILRYVILCIYIVACLIGISTIVTILDPYAAFGRISNQLLQPLWIWCNNLLAMLAEHFDSYAFYNVDVWLKGIAAIVVASATLIIIAILAWRSGRTYCNTICPVGSLLGLMSRYSLFRITIDTTKCNGCTLCQRNCKASCIDAKSHIIDYSRCVVCGNCIDKCNRNALSYKLRWHTKSVSATSNPTDTDRRTFIATASLMVATAAKAQIKNDGGLAAITNKIAPERTTRIVPAGSQSVNNFLNKCVGCQLCVSVCPNEVLRPSLIQPQMSYERGYCRPECTKCSEVCPAGAIIKIDRADKSSTQIGHAIWISKNCVPLTDDVECGNCARHCPSGAITMIPSDPNNPTSHKIPAINEERCIGCGACENLCPARPFSAIYVEGHDVHRTI